jgi:hypothetical protein
MKFINIIHLLSLLIVILTASCKTPSNISYESIYDIDSSLGIEKVPSSLGSDYQSQFDRYTKITAPNGKAIHIAAQHQVSNEKIVRTRNVLQHYLTDYPGSHYGSDKTDISNKIADNNAVLLLLNGEDNGENDPLVDGQPLYDMEIQIEGGSWYINQNYDHRDATYEEILHFVHDYGIGVDGGNSAQGALPKYQKEIRSAQIKGLNSKLWGTGQPAWISELTKENSLSQEYFASVIDSYYGLWGAWKENSTHGMWGIYTAKTRDEIKTEDPEGMKLLNNKFVHPYITYNARIDSDFKGDFSMKFNSSLPYTHHSRYLKDITLTGSFNSNVIVNELNNNITGNTGVNKVIFSGKSSEYTIRTILNITTISDRISNRDGINILHKIETLQFSNCVIEL